jgi:transcription elongation factor Elf1
MPDTENVNRQTASTFISGTDLIGVALKCGECGQMHDFKINGVGVHFP